MSFFVFFASIIPILSFNYFGRNKEVPKLTYTEIIGVVVHIAASLVARIKTTTARIYVFHYNFNFPL